MSQFPPPHQSLDLHLCRQPLRQHRKLLLLQWQLQHRQPPPLWLRLHLSLWLPWHRRQCNQSHRPDPLLLHHLLLLSLLPNLRLRHLLPWRHRSKSPDRKDPPLHPSRRCAQCGHDQPHHEITVKLNEIVLKRWMCDVCEYVE